LKRILTLKCPIIYIGSTSHLGGNEAKARVIDLAGKRRTVFLPVLLLRLAGVGMDLGYKELSSKEEAKRKEKELLEQYKQIHDEFPALNEQERNRRGNPKKNSKLNNKAITLLDPFLQL